MTVEQNDVISMIERDYDSQILLLNDQLAAIARADEDSGQNQPQILGMPGMGENVGFAIGNAGDSGVVDGNSGGGAWVVSHRIEVTTDGTHEEIEHIVDGGNGPLLGLDNLLMMPSGDLGSHDADSPKGRLARSKQELIARTIDAVHGVLSPEQQALAPKPDKNEMLSPEERMRRRMEEAFSNMVISDDGSGNVSLEIRVGDEDGGN
jgi:hypothetical protein